MRDHLSIIGIQRWQLRSKPAESISSDSQRVHRKSIAELESSLDGSIETLVKPVTDTNSDGIHKEEAASRSVGVDKDYGSSNNVGEDHSKQHAIVDVLSVSGSQSSDVNVEAEGVRSDPDRVSAYAAHSYRVNDKVEQQHWLWVVPQARFTSKELQLLDKIVTATGSEWKSTGVADNYCAGLELNAILEKEVEAIVVFGMTEQECQLKWPELIAHSMYQQKRCYLAASLQELISDASKKRIVWQNLQSLM